MPPEGVFTLREERLVVVPVVPDRLECAYEVRRAILSIRPAVVALELPPAIGATYVEAVKRFPYLSTLIVEEDDGSDATLIRVEPTDPFAEAVRTATDAEIPVEFIDLEIGTGAPLPHPLPDPYSIYHTGLETWYRACHEKVLARERLVEHYEKLLDRNPELRDPLTDSFSDAAAIDAARVGHLAAELAQLIDNTERDVLFVCNVHHAANVMQKVHDGTGRRRHLRSTRQVTLGNPDLDFIRATSAEMPFMIAAYEFDRKGSGPDPRVWEAPPDPPPSPEPSPLDALTAQDVMGSLESLLGISPKTQEVKLTPEQIRVLVKRLQALRDSRSVSSLPGMGNSSEPPPRLEGPGQVAAHRIFKFRSVSERGPALRELYTETARLRSDRHRMLDRQRALVRMVKTAARFYEENTGEKFKPWQLRTMFRYLRSLARVKDRQLLPQAWWDWAVAARSICDDNYAHEVWDLASFYPWVEQDGKYRSLSIDGEDIKLDARKMRFRLRWPRLRERLAKSPVRRRPQETNSGDWARGFDQGAICSYPPEDIVIEDYARYLKKKALLVLSEERTRTEPFTTSLLDGIDVRETIRNWPRTKHQPHGRIYVREVQKVKGGAGAVVVIFDEDRNEARYPWCMTWHGEHTQESDMAFYSTPVYARLVGPGIARCEYGGLMMTYPPRRVSDVWSDPFYQGEAESKAEVLLLAALEYSPEKHVVYVSATPPRSRFRSIANRLGKKIVYLPIGQLSPVSVKRLRVFHVLSGHQVRAYARDHIW